MILFIYINENNSTIFFLFRRLYTNSHHSKVVAITILLDYFDCIYRSIHLESLSKLSIVYRSSGKRFIFRYASKEVLLFDVQQFRQLIENCVN